MKSVPPPSKLESILQSRDFALSLAIIIMLTQSIHTSHALYELTSLPNVFLKVVFAVTTAICVDFLMIFFVSHREVRISYVFFAFTSLMNIYAYHIDHANFLNIDSIFMCIAGIAVPFAVHAIAMHKYQCVVKNEEVDEDFFVSGPKSLQQTQTVNQIPEVKDQLVFGTDGVQW